MGRWASLLVNQEITRSCLIGRSPQEGTRLHMSPREFGQDLDTFCGRHDWPKGLGLRVRLLVRSVVLAREARDLIDVVTMRLTSGRATEAGAGGVRAVGDGKDGCFPVSCRPARTSRMADLASRRRWTRSGSGFGRAGRQPLREDGAARLGHRPSCRPEMRATSRRRRQLN
jgi:hypothetical protein